MKLITAIVRPEKLDGVTRAVTGAGVFRMTVTLARGFGRQYGHLVAIRLGDREVLILPKLRIDVAVQDEAADLVADAIAKSVNAGSAGDGRILVCPVENAFRVRTGERDHGAI